MSWGFFIVGKTRFLLIILSTGTPVVFAIGATGRAAMAVADGTVHNFFVTGTARIHGI